MSAAIKRLRNWPKIRLLYGVRARTVRYIIWLVVLTVAVAVGVVVLWSRDPDAAGDVLAVASTIAASVFAAIGAATTPTQNSRLTTWGWISIAGVAISTVFALTIRSIETHRDSEREELRRQQYEQTLALTGRTLRSAALAARSATEAAQDVRRLATPVSIGYIGVWLQFPSDAPIFERWMARVRVLPPFASRKRYPVLPIPGNTIGIRDVLFDVTEHGDIRPDGTKPGESAVTALFAAPLRQQYWFTKGENGFPGLTIDTKTADCTTRIFVSKMAVYSTKPGTIVVFLDCNSPKVTINSFSLSSFIDLVDAELNLSIEAPTRPSASLPTPQLASIDVARSRAGPFWHLSGAQFKRSDEDDWAWSHVVTAGEFAQ